MQVEYRVHPPITNETLNALFADAWPQHEWRDFTPVLTRSLGYVCAYLKNQLVGFVNVAWDGDKHAFLLDPTVRSDLQRQGIGTELVRQAEVLACQRGAEWLHVDFEPHLREFYRWCGFRPTKAGLIHLTERSNRVE